MDKDTENLIEKINKLLAKANDPSVGEEEAAAFAAKAQKYLTQHALTMADIESHGGQKREGIDGLTWVPKYGENGWRKQVAMSAARVYMCDVVFTKVPVKLKSRTTGRIKVAWRAGYIVIGRPSATSVFTQMCSYLFDTVVRLSRSYSSDQRERHLFEKGCGIRLMDRLNDLYAEQTRVSTERTANVSNLPMLYKNELALVDEFIKETMKDVKEGTASFGSVDAVHTTAGMAAANSISLNTQVGSDSATRDSLPKGDDVLLLS